MNDFRDFTAQACTVIEGCQHIIDGLVKENQQLKNLAKQASEVKQSSEVKQAPEVKLDDDILRKAAAAVHEMHGSPNTCTPEDIAEYWKANPSTMLSTINKMASANIAAAAAAAATGNVTKHDLGKLVSKKASAPGTKTKPDADKEFWGEY